MSTPAEIEWERQFQEDLAKATALSLEQQALDEYRRNKKYGGSPSASTAEASTTDSVQKYYAQLRSRHLAAREHSPSHSTSNQRRNSEVSITLEPPTRSGRERSSTPQRTDESDLISFSSPTSKESEVASFEKLIENLQNLEMAPNMQNALVPFGATASAQTTPSQHAYQSVPMHGNYSATSIPQYAAPVNATAGMLVPYQPIQQSAAQQPKPLTNEDLQKLYNMPTQLALVQQTCQQPMGFVRPVQYYNATHYMPTHAPPVFMPGTAAYMAPQYPAQAYGFKCATPATINPNIQPNDINQRSSKVDAQSAASSSSSITTHSMQQTAKSILNLHTRNHSKSKAVRTGTPALDNDLIDLSQLDDSRVSVLEAFDPLLNDGSVSRK